MFDAADGGGNVDDDEEDEDDDDDDDDDDGDDDDDDDDLFVSVVFCFSLRVVCCLLVLPCSGVVLSLKK